MDRRLFLATTATMLAASAAASEQASAAAANTGALDASTFGVFPNGIDDQTRAFSQMLQAASDRDLPIFLPSGTYLVSGLKLPARVRLSGVPGASRIVYGGDRGLLLAEKTELLQLDGITLDGANRWIDEPVRGLIDARSVAQIAIDNCRIVGSGKHGVSLEGCAGRIERSEISGAAGAGLYSVEGKGLQILNNTISACGDGGILIHRWEAGDDGTMVSGNRVSRIAAISGGTGQNGNGINVFRANGVSVVNNQVTECAFSAIRGNAASNLQVSGNTCLQSGETAIYSEFGFEGAIIANNVVDGAANGISVVNFNEGGRMAVCSGNLVRNLRTTGPYTPDPPGWGSGISVEAETTVTGNVIENAPMYGIALGWGEFMRNVVANGNVIRNVAVGVAVTVVEGVGAAVITDNIIDGAKDGGVVGFRWAKAATGDLTRKPPASGNLVVERNHVS